MYLKDLIEELEKHDPTKIVEHGFEKPHSFRGIYADLAFEPAYNIAIGDMLSEAKYALGKTFSGWKGGEFFMGEYTECWISVEGKSHNAQKIGRLLLKLMLK